MLPEAGLTITAEDVVRAAIDRGLDAIVVVDHNTVEAIDSLRTAAASTRLVLLPGIEITARGGHVLAVLDLETPVSLMRQLLRAVGLNEEHQGDGYHQSSLWLDQVSERIEEYGGLAIAAHIDRQPRGFVVSGEPLSDRMRIHASPYLSALEITIPQNKTLWNQGEIPGYPKKYACIQGSDAHAPGEIGRRVVFLRIPEVNLDNLRVAFWNYEERVRFPEEVPCEGKLVP